MGYISTKAREEEKLAQLRENQDDLVTKLASATSQQEVTLISNEIAKSHMDKIHQEQQGLKIMNPIVKAVDWTTLVTAGTGMVLSGGNPAGLALGIIPGFFSAKLHGAKSVADEILDKEIASVIEHQAGITEAFRKHGCDLTAASDDLKEMMLLKKREPEPDGTLLKMIKENKVGAKVLHGIGDALEAVFGQEEPKQVQPQAVQKPGLKK